MRLSQLVPPVLGLGVLAVSAVPAFAQTDEAVIVVDVMVVNDDGGTLDGTTVAFEHATVGGGSTTGMDGDTEFKCLTTDGGNCYIFPIPTGSGELTVPTVDGYTITIDCTTMSPGSTATGGTWDAQAAGEIFCVVMLDDDAPVETTTTTSTTTTTTTTTTLPETTTTTTTLPPTTVPAPIEQPAEPTTTTTLPAPVMELPETGPGDTGSLALLALALIAGGAATIRLARR